ncbi:hypothetical protein DAPPUDRAFT_242922 [Daphnia pulex]|uniref:Uncharacterized protein n=1 Tax=Daphnia pulex TaxID=6669 RepID=E9GHN5_DAPPU|nr:hypothetical protein DAPPUDRAFT_242922 [Daphnia pulex]|eukprot:EFX81023.1 hypothetical protein DAPPUDRAFT_242922 [Daphnia pulex]
MLQDQNYCVAPYPLPTDIIFKFCMSSLDSGCWLLASAQLSSLLFYQTRKPPDLETPRGSKLQCDETMSRENRRVAAISWSSTDSAVGIGGSDGKSVPSASSEQSLSGPTTYLVAPNSEVLAQLIRDNETRADAGHYTSPASAFNRFTEPNEPSCEHMEQERRMLDRERRLSVAASSSDRSDTDSMDGANAYKKDRSTPLQGNQLDDQSVVVKNLEP